MTQDEKREQKAMLLLEFKEAEDHHAHLREKARRIEQGLTNATVFLSAMNSSSEFHVSHPINTTRGAVLKIDDALIRKSMDFEAYLKLGEEIEQSQANIRELAARKESLGL